MSATSNAPRLLAATCFTLCLFLVERVGPTYAASPETTIRHFETVTDLTGVGEGAAFGSVDSRPQLVSFSALGRRFDLELEPNEVLTGRTSVRWVGKGRGATSPSVALYKGWVRGEPSSWLRLTMSAAGLDGMIVTGDETYYLEAVGSGGMKSIIYRQSDTDPGREIGTCTATVQREGFGGSRARGFNGRTRPVSEPNDPPALGPSNPSDGGGALAGLTEVQVSVVADYEYFSRYGSGTEARLLSVMNAVDGIYEVETGISLRVTNLLIFTTSDDLFSSASGAYALLEELSELRNLPRYCTNGLLFSCERNPSLSCVSDEDCGTAAPCLATACDNDADCGGGGTCIANSLYASDLVHLFTGRNLSGSTVGMAWLNGLCSTYSGAGLSQDLGDSYLRTLLAAHEIGHNFGAPHDNETDSACALEPFGKIMNPLLSSSLADELSTCSKAKIATLTGYVRCLSLSNDPTPPPSPTATPRSATATRTRTRTPTLAPSRTPTVTRPPATATPTQTQPRAVVPSNTPIPFPTPRRTLNVGIGVFRPNTRAWFLDDHDITWEGCGSDACVPGFGAAGDIAVVGDWNGSGMQNIGVFRPSTGAWILDDGNRRFDGCAVDRCLGPFGAVGDRPVVGDWAGTGQVRIGVFRSSGGFWMLDNGNGRFDGCGWDPCVSKIGAAGDQPVVGEWTGTGQTMLGVFRPRTQQWMLDRNGNRVWEGCAVDVCYTGFGMIGDQGFVRDWFGQGNWQIGVFHPATGQWVVDENGNGRWDGCGSDLCGSFGTLGDQAITGNW